MRTRWLCVVLVAAGCRHDAPASSPSAADAFDGSAAGESREIAGVALRWCPPGSFRMGSPPGEPERRPDEVQVDVTLSRGFWMAEHEATQGEWRRVVGPLPGAVDAGESDRFPVHSVNWPESESFCRALTQSARAQGALPAAWEFRLPTEAQWEYACRAGTTTATAFGDALGSAQANFSGDKPYNGGAPGPSLRRAAAVGRYPANAWGLRDLHGNVFEWCRDWYHARLPGGVDPDLSGVRGAANGDGTWSRSRRGGAFVDEGWPCRSASRLRFEPERRSDHIGFRVAAVRVTD